ncbi:MAG TPA: hypothetical protein VGJ95_06230 [Pseudonocardiaceae bacterium]
MGALFAVPVAHVADAAGFLGWARGAGAGHDVLDGSGDCKVMSW